MSIPITIPGGAKVLADPDDPRDREFVLEMIGVFGPVIKTIRARMHNDCVACGRCSDLSHYEAMLLKAGEVLERHFPGVEILLIFVDFDGFYLVEKDEVLAEAAVR